MKTAKTAKTVKAKKFISERQAWLLMADAWEKTFTKIDNTGFSIVIGVFCPGLCLAVATLRNRKVSCGTADKMRDKILEYRKQNSPTGVFIWPTRDNKSRIEFCKAMAKNLEKKSKKTISK